MNITFLGCGNMGEAFLKSGLKNFVFPPEKVLVIERTEDRRNFLEETYGVQTSNNHADLKHADIIFLAIKPQGLFELPVTNSKGKTVISILAGSRIQALTEKFPGARIVRAMPNLGQFVGEGCTGLSLPSALPGDHEATVMALFESGGKTIVVDDESKLDDITALSGSGPAYFFYFVEQLAQIAHKHGFSLEESKTIAHQTLFGAAEVLKQNPNDAAGDWSKKVTSKGGTTEKALEYLKGADFGKIVEGAVEAATKQAKILGK